ncbi:flavodoxin I [Lachnospiraceae bacterium PF1-21]
MLDYLVLYQSRSGNTARLATRIFSALPGNSKDIIDLASGERLPEAKVYFVGFGVYQGTCHIGVSDFLSQLSGKIIALFATCGLGDSNEYKKEVAATTAAWIEDDNIYLGAYICQGKFPQALRKKCEERHAEALLSRFDQALTHPDEVDMQGAEEFVAHSLKKIEGLRR